jgi:release factor glutamine methyltransferase
LTQAAGSIGELRSLLERRASGEPLEYVVGWAGFYGLRVPVRHGVFIPRRRSEFLAECAVQAARAAAGRTLGDARRVKVLDMCCGSGAIGLAVAANVPGVDLLACDNSPAAVECARGNLATVSGRVYAGNMFDPIPRTELHDLDVIVANTPHVPTDEIRRLPAEARLHEPVSALDGGRDGTSVQRALLDSAAEWLKPSGLVLIETEGELAAQTARIAAGNGYGVEIRESPELNAAVVLADLCR